MHLFFIDESGSIPPKDQVKCSHFVLGGLIIPEEQWHNLENDFFRICKQFQVTGEVKWRFFGQKIGHEDKGNTLSHLELKDRDQFRKCLLTKITTYKSIKIISAVTHLPTIYATSLYGLTPEAVYSMTYKPLTERFQYYLQDLSRTSGSKFNGIIVCDHRNQNQDRILRNFHNDLIKTRDITKSIYSNLIEHLFLSPSHYSIGLQFADLISGAIYRYFEHGDKKWYDLIESSFRKDPQRGETIDGYGLVRFPRKKWQENDAESRTRLEPAILTQSQRNSDGI